MTGHVLVVDDSTVFRRLLAAACEHLGHTVDTAADGEQALRLLRAPGAAVDVVLLDLLMPVLDGFATLERIKADPALAHLPVIVVSADGELASVVRCIDAGAADHLAKPFEPALLRARLDASLAAKRARDDELAYLRRVGELTDAAREVDSGRYDTTALDAAARPADALGDLARVFADLVRAAAAREAALRHAVEELRVEVDAARQARELERITGTAGYRRLREGAADLKRILKEGS
ncbi:MAG: response regulator [Pseudonocardia sp.]